MALSAYTSVESVLALAPSIGSFSTVNSARVLGYISAVSADIDATLGRAYDTPFSAAPPDIIRIASDLSMAKAIRSILPFAPDSMREWYGEFIGDLNGAREDLESYAKGERTLVNSAGDVVERITSQRQYHSANAGYKPVFDMRDQNQWAVDPDRTDAEADEVD